MSKGELLDRVADGAVVAALFVVLLFNILPLITIIIQELVLTFIHSATFTSLNIFFLPSSATKEQVAASERSKKTTVTS